MWGMSHSLPSGMSRYAFSPQDSDFPTYTTGFPAVHHRGGRNSATMYGEYATGNSLGHISHMTSSTSSIGGTGNYHANNSGTNLIVNYLPQDMQDRELYSLFRTIGPINTCRIMRDYKVNTGYSFGYAFVDFASELDAQRAIKSLNGVTVRNKRLKVSFARPSGENIKDTNLYVTNLPRTITEDQLDVIFGKYGQIVQKNILRDKLTGKPRGVAFIRFSKREEAQEAISALNNVIPEGGVQPINVRVAEEHGKAKANTYVMGANHGMYNNVMHRGRQKIRFPKVHPYQNPNYL